MKATIKQPETNYLPESNKYAPFEWYEVKTNKGELFKALPSTYGVIYINSYGNVSFSNRDFFNDNYTIIKHIPSITITFESSK